MNEQNQRDSIMSMARRILALEPDVRTACTACALKGLGK